MDEKAIRLYGLPHSLYTAKLRADLRKQGIAYCEVPPTDERFADRIVPAIGRAIMSNCRTVRSFRIWPT